MRKLNDPHNELTDAPEDEALVEAVKAAIAAIQDNMQFPPGEHVGLGIGFDVGEDGTPDRVFLVFPGELPAHHAFFWHWGIELLDEKTATRRRGETVMRDGVLQAIASIYLNHVAMGLGIQRLETDPTFLPRN